MVNYFQNLFRLFDKKDSFTFTPIIILIWGIYSVLYIAPISIASGFGWDGVEYAKIALNWEDIIGHLDKYRAARIFPSILIHYILKIFHIQLTLNSILSGFQVYNILVLFAASIVWVQICKIALYSSSTKWVGFCALFINYPVLNWYFYYPALTDSTAFFMGFLLLYGYLVKNKFIIIITSIISFFCWPTMFVIGFLFYIYMEFNNSFYVETVNKRLIVFIMSIVLGPLIIYVIYFNFSGIINHVIFDTGLNDKLSLKLKRPNKISSFSLNMFVNSVIMIGYLITACWIVVKNFDIYKILKITFEKRTFTKVVISVMMIIVLSIIKSGIYSAELSTVTTTAYIKSVVIFGTRFLFQFIVCHIIYWGPFILLVIIYWRDFIKSIKSSDLPIVLGFLSTLLFTINAEGRAITNFYPFIVFILLNVIDFDKLKNKKVFFSLFIVVSILYSKIWLSITLPSTVFPEIILTDLDKFPMQWYFMNFGLWINKEMYILHTLVSVFLFMIFYLVLKSSNMRKYA